MKTRIVMMMVLVGAVAACGGGHDPNDGHGHGDGTSNDEMVEGESWAVTAWGEHFELFPEIDALVSNETAGAHVHVTVLDGFKPATEGSVTVVLLDSMGVDERFSATEVIRPGISGGYSPSEAPDDPTGSALRKWSFWRSGKTFS